MKTLFAVIAGIVLLAAFTAPADIATQSFGVTNTFAANITTTDHMGSAVKIDNQDSCGIELKFQGNASGTGNVTTTLVRSIDGTTFETSPKITWIVPLNNTTAVVAYTNLSSSVIGSAGYIKVLSVANADAGAGATNCSITLIKKNVTR